MLAGIPSSHHCTRSPNEDKEDKGKNKRCKNQEEADFPCFFNRAYNRKSKRTYHLIIIKCNKSGEIEVAKDVMLPKA